MCGWACISCDSLRVTVCGNGSNVYHLRYVHQECLKSFAELAEKEEAKVVRAEIEWKIENEWGIEDTDVSYKDEDPEERVFFNLDVNVPLEMKPAICISTEFEAEISRLKATDRVILLTEKPTIDKECFNEMKRVVDLIQWLDPAPQFEVMISSCLQTTSNGFTDHITR